MTALSQRPGVVLEPVRPASPTLWIYLLVASAVAGVALRLAFDVHLIIAFALSYAAYAALVWVAYRVTAGRRQAANAAMRALITGAFLIAVIPLVSLIVEVVTQGSHLINTPNFWSTGMEGVDGRSDKSYLKGETPFLGGALDAMAGTLIITALATAISVPVGVLTSIYLVEYAAKNRLSRAIRFFVDVMTGVPSIVAGLFAFALFSLLFGPGTKSGLSGAVALSVLMIPTVVRNSEEMLRIVPNELREAALALGVPKWRTITKVVLPTAASGLASGVTLAISRVIGETAPVLVAVGYARQFNSNPVEGPMSTLALYIYQMFRVPLVPSQPYAQVSIDRAWAAALILISLVVLLNITARLIAKFFAPKTGR